MGLKETLQTVGKALSGGMAGAAAEKLDPAARRKRIDDAVDGNTSTPAPASSYDSDSKMVDPRTKIRFAKGGMVRRGYGKARGA